MLLDLALRQALGAISLSLGLDAPDGLALETLLQRVPSDHRASALVGRLADPRTRTAVEVGRLIEALSSPGPARPDRTRQDRTRRGAAKAAEPSSPSPAATASAGRTVVAGGPTAFEAAAARRAHADPAPARDYGEPRDVSSAAFWALMDRWPVSDPQALRLLGGERPLTRTGGRPRFRLRGAEAARYAMLHRIDTALEMLGEPPAWLSRAQDAAPFAGRTPLALLEEDPDAASGRILRALNRAGLRAASPGKARQTPRR